MRIAIGATPTLEFELPFDCDGVVKDIRLTFKQGEEIVVEKRLADCTLDGRTVGVTLTREETLLLSHSVIVKIQAEIRTLDDKYIPSDILYVNCSELLNKGDF